MDILGAILLFVKDYGLPLVGLVLLIMWLKPKADEAWSVLMDRAKQVQPHNVQKEFDKMLEVDLDVNVLIAEALHETNSDYVTIWQFHNGAISFGGIPFLRLSVTHQQVRSGLFGWGHTYQNLPTSLFVACKAFREMGDNFAIVECCDSNGNETIIGILRAHDIKSMFVQPVRDSHGMLIALITISYTKPCSRVDEQRKIFSNYALRLSILLELQAKLSKGG